MGLKHPKFRILILNEFPRDSSIYPICNFFAMFFSQVLSSPYGFWGTNGKGGQHPKWLLKYKQTWLWVTTKIIYI
jgi:hypothetical protein